MSKLHEMLSANWIDVISAPPCGKTADRLRRCGISNIVDFVFCPGCIGKPHFIF